MWILLNSSGRKYFVSGDKDVHSVGRDAGSNLMIENDKSISRLHAQLKPSPEKLILIDTDSRYGIFLNEYIEKIVRLPAKEVVDLKPGDTVQFGRFESKWKVEKTQFNVVTSSLPGLEAEKLAETLKMLSGKSLKTYSSDCTHLVMPQIIITMKALLALVSEVPIVCPEFFSALLQSAQKNTPPPDPLDFIPEIREENLIKQNCSFHPDSERRKVFCGKRFIFLSQEVMKRYETVIQLAGGVSVNIETDTLSQRSFVQVGTIVISSDTAPGAREWENVKRIEEKLKDKGCRFVPEKEIALAIIYKSTRKFCNPLYNFTEVFATNSRRSPGEILVQDTPMIEGKSPQKAVNVTLPETLQDHVSVTLSEIQGIPEQKSQHVEIPETFEEPPKIEKRKRSWTRAEKVEDPPKKSQKKTLNHVEANTPEKPAPVTTTREKRRLKSLLDSSQFEDCDIAPKKPRSRAPEPLPEKSLRSTRSSVSQKSQEHSEVPLSRPATLPTPLNLSSVETKSTGWLSKKFSEASLDDSAEESIKTKSDESSWIDSMKASVLTKVVDFADSRTSSMVSDTTDCGSKKNFKAFKRKQSFIAQKVAEKLVYINPGRGE